MEKAAKLLQHVAVKLLPEKIRHPLDLDFLMRGIKGLHFEGLAEVLDASQSNRTSEAYVYLRHLMVSSFILIYLGAVGGLVAKNGKSFYPGEQERGGQEKRGVAQEKCGCMKKPILAAAKDLRAQDKRLTQSDLATKILDKKWIGIAWAPVSHAYLITQISKWENSGELPKAAQ